MTLKDRIALSLADALLAGPAIPNELLARGESALGERPDWLTKLVERIDLTFGVSLVNLGRVELSRLIVADEGFSSAWHSDRKRPRVRRYSLIPPVMGPRPLVFRDCHLPEIATSGDLAQWLGVSISDLEWFANAWTARPGGGSGPLHHYVYRWVPKPHGVPRLLEIPKSRLREIQRRILRSMLDRVPIHEAAHGFRRGRSCLTHAGAHVGRQVVIRMDLKDFFPSIPAARVHALFRALGYPETVARMLTHLCTNQVPPAVVSSAAQARAGVALNFHDRKRYRAPHLPQGAPPSPALANLCAYRLDLRLALAANAAGANYTRYADDLTFSGGELLGRSAQRFHVLVCRIALEEGFAVNTRKTRVMRSAVRQQVTGLVINARPNLPREQWDRLKAILHNCVRHGPANQNRDGLLDFRAYLQGCLAHAAMVNPGRAVRLKELFCRIRWN